MAAIRGEGTIELQLDSRVEGIWTILDVAGEVDLSTAPSLRDELNSLVESGTRKLVVNLEQVGFMDSSGLGVLVAGLKRLKEAGGEMALVCRDGPTLKVLAITGLDRVFPIHPSVADALAP
ncbi:MAG TPA: STAS domain-containing protein [Actinomycetota bacterium]